VEAERFHAIATGKLVRLNEHLEEYLATLNNEAKTVDMKRSTITKFCDEFPYVADVQRKAVQRWVNAQATDGKKPATIECAMSEIRGYWAYLQSIEVVPENFLPFAKPSIPKAGKGVDDGAAVRS
jgi:site-specific recombinase XerD